MSCCCYCLMTKHLTLIGLNLFSAHVRERLEFLVTWHLFAPLDCFSPGNPGKSKASVLRCLAVNHIFNHIYKKKCAKYFITFCHMTWICGYLQCFSFSSNVTCKLRRTVFFSLFFLLLLYSIQCKVCASLHASSLYPNVDLHAIHYIHLHDITC